MQNTNRHSLENFPKDFHSRIIKDDLGNYWISCQLQSDIINGENDTFHALNPSVIMNNYEIKNGIIIYND
jgi:hypothetical protein